MTESEAEEEDSNLQILSEASLKDRIARRATKALEHIDIGRGSRNVSQKRRNLLYGWMDFYSLLVLNIGIFIQYTVIWGSSPRSHGWKALGGILGFDIDDQSMDCETRSGMIEGQVKEYTRCTPTVHLGLRTLGCLLYIGLYTLFMTSSCMFLRFTRCRESQKFRKHLDNVTFWTGLISFLDILMCLSFMYSKLGGIKAMMLEDTMNLPDPFISHYWEATQTRGQCCGVYGGPQHWLIPKADQPQSFPSSCCNYKINDCSTKLKELSKIWDTGCLNSEYNHILCVGSIHIILLVLQLVLVLHFDSIQRRFAGARETFFPKWVIYISGQQRAVIPIKSTRLHYVSHTRDWEEYRKRRQKAHPSNPLNFSRRPDDSIGNETSPNPRPFHLEIDTAHILK